MARYKIGEIVASTGISPYTLKFYEREGLITPVTDGQSGYRYYDVPDIGTLLAIHQLRQWGFTVKEIRETMDGLSVEGWVSCLRDKQQANCEQILRLQAVNRAIEERLSWFERFQRMKGGWELREIPAFHYLEHCAASEANLKQQAPELPESIARNVDGFMAVRVPMGHVRGDEPAYWGMLYFDHLDTRDAWRGIGTAFPGGECFVYYHSEPISPYFTPLHLRSALEAMRAAGMEQTGDVYGLYLAGTVNGQAKIENYAFFAPVKKISKMP